MSFKDVVSEATRTAKEAVKNEHEVDHIKDMGDGKSMSEFIKEHVQNKEHDASTKTIADKAKGIAPRKIDEIKHDKELAETPAEETIKNRIDEARTRQRENGGFSVNGRLIHGGPEGAKSVNPETTNRYEGMTTAEIAHAEQNRMYQEGRLPNSPDKNGEEHIRQIDLASIYGVDSIGKGGLNDPMSAEVKFDDVLAWGDDPSDGMKAAMVGYGSMSCNILNAHDSSLKDGETWEFLGEEKGFAVFKNGMQTDKTLGLMPNDVRMYCESMGSPMTNDEAIKLHRTQTNLYSEAVDEYVNNAGNAMKDYFFNKGMKAITRDGLEDSGPDSQSEVSILPVGLNGEPVKIKNDHGVDLTEHLGFVKSTSVDQLAINGCREGKSVTEIAQDIKNDLGNKLGGIFKGASKDAKEIEKRTDSKDVEEPSKESWNGVFGGLANGFSGGAFGEFIEAKQPKAVDAEMQSIADAAAKAAESKEAENESFFGKFMN